MVLSRQNVGALVRGAETPRVSFPKGEKMKIKLIRAAVVDCVTHPAGTVLEVNEGEGRLLVSRGKAETFIEPKLKAKKAPENKMVDVDELETR